MRLHTVYGCHEMIVLFRYRKNNYTVFHLDAFDEMRLLRNLRRAAGSAVIKAHPPDVRYAQNSCVKQTQAMLRK